MSGVRVLAVVLIFSTRSVDGLDSASFQDNTLTTVCTPAPPRFADKVRGTLNKHMGFPERRATKLHVARTDKESD